jgi:hypothetical protein
MKTRSRKSKYIFLLVLSMAVVLVCLPGVIVIRSQGPGLKPPKVISKVKTIEVLQVEVDGQNSSTAVVVMTLRNNTDKNVIALAVESGDDKNASGVNESGYGEGDDPPTVIIKPHGIFKMEMPFSYVRPGAPIKVGGVMYDDETEEGDEVTLKSMRKHKELRKSKKIR